MPKPNTVPPRKLRQIVNNPTKTITRYLKRHAVGLPRWVTLAPPADELRICVVIPAYDELETIGDIISSLNVVDLPIEAVEIIACVNQSVAAPDDVTRRNAATLKLLNELETPFALHVIDRCTEGRAFPADDAGVGRARRLLMDLATRRLHAVGSSDTGLIACLDGDSPPDPGYLDDIWREMKASPQVLAGHCRYRHPIPEEKEHARAIMAYEVWMRYFEAALHLTGTPYAFHSIGSCMVVTARGYALADGVPTREALSDFYLLQKIAKVGGPGSVRQLQRPLVRPSARLSTRVPRGTGPSVRASMHRNEERFVFVEPPRAFVDLQRLFAAVPGGFANPHVLRRAASPFLLAVMERWNGWETIDKLRTHAPDEARFERQFHTWFDSLKIVKYANRCRERHGGVWVFAAILRLLGPSIDPQHRAVLDIEETAKPTLDEWHKLLTTMRELELHRWGETSVPTR